MNWGSPAAFFAMGGYALYVWGSFGVCALALLVELLLVRGRHRAIVARLRRMALAEKIERDTP